MPRIYYRHLDLDPALAWVGVPAHTVWYYQPEPKAPEPWTHKDYRPPKATAVVVASANKDFSAGTPMGELEIPSDKDPIPPPPPPPYYSDLVEYLKQPDALKFFLYSPRDLAV